MNSIPDMKYIWLYLLNHLRMDILLYALQPNQINSKLVFWIYFKKQTKLFQNRFLHVIYSTTKLNKFKIGFFDLTMKPNQINT